MRAKALGQDWAQRIPGPEPEFASEAVRISCASIWKAGDLASAGRVLVSCGHTIPVLGGDEAEAHFGDQRWTNPPHDGAIEPRTAGPEGV